MDREQWIWCGKQYGLEGEELDEYVRNSEEEEKVRIEEALEEAREAEEKAREKEEWRR